MRARFAVLLVVLALVASTCADEGDTSTAVSGTPAGETAAPVDDAETDYGLPSTTPAEPTGALGFDRYVWSLDDAGEVIPVVVEGPRGGQARCQEPARDCSYQDLKRLVASGTPVPDDLGVTAEELADLVEELDEAAAAVNAFDGPAAACAAGYEPTSAQNPNMGIHFVNTGLLDDGFDIARPEMLLFAAEDGVGLSRAELGSCDGDRWEGLEMLEVVGAAYFIGLSEDHPDGFTGPLDQWHVHYNSCANGNIDSTASERLCAANGGTFFEFQPNWMMHAYVADGFDSQTGVFAMWNDSIWPLSSRATESAAAAAAADTASTITDFTFDNLTVTAGESVGWVNGDEVPHTVVTGTPVAPGAFESAPLGTDEGYTLTFDEPGVVPIYCSLHPQMTGVVTVRR